MDIKPYVKTTKIAGLYKIDREIFWDNRGFFREVYHKDELEKTLGHQFNPVQLNHSLSQPKVLRGIHPDPWDKLVYPLNGQVFIAIVDIDPLSPTFKHVETFNVDDNNRHGLFVAKGLGNSLCVLGQEAVHYIYLVTEYWDGHAMSGMRAVAYNDPDLNIAWPIKDPILSDKDKQNKTLREHYQKEYPNLFK